MISRPPSQLPIAALLIVAAATALSLFLSVPQNEWLFTGEKAIPYGSEQLRWWIFLLPLALGGGAIVSLSLIVAARALRDGHRLGACAAFAVGVLGTVALATALSFGEQWRIFQQQPRPRPPRPLTWIDAFIPEQWWDLAFRLRESPLTPPHLRKGGVGVEGYPGYIPFDPFLLRRVSFVGLTPDAVAGLLGPTVPREQGSNSVRYSMAGGPEHVAASLYLAIEKDEHGIPRVVSEHLDVSRGIVCGVIGGPAPKQPQDASARQLPIPAESLSRPDQRETDALKLKLSKFSADCVALDPIEVVRGAVVPPSVMRIVQPDYSPAAGRPRHATRFILDAIVDSQGNLCDAVVAPGEIQVLDPAAKRALLQWKFIPATRGGLPYACVFRFAADLRLQ